ncbi:MAG TPA: DUF3570 domain-containing protein [candidate division Zixibacteria bacterium]|nr:DUF3570 domain-containing protein [candidate division Zixibacteria bacterium]MDD4916964.1 DUF3570 domain-containing protein [candidate division Zixibacteria bacterium]MDM7974176.1 DUF3570 domain-containing protein [candidate division Zixibacteria bacterium]HPC11515.1 DUF3570 domain-containing protein [candidate division Zixibacteria bacterium]HPI33424.1 DUF3570 domain-containing protein [candidate division Zixibacteria bacterium]
MRMQLTNRPPLRGALSALTAALLGTGAAASEGRNRVESSILLYSEVDRVQAAEAIIGLGRALKGDRMLSARLTLDGLTGASPNGATPSARVQTFTRPSGEGGYSVKPGEIPLDDTFKDTRYSFDGSLAQPLDRLTTIVLGAHYSGEHDYTSLGASVGLSRDLNRKNTTLSASAAYSRDRVRPEGGPPDPLSSMSARADDDDDDDAGERELAAQDDDGDDDDDEDRESDAGEGKNVYDVVFGLTQVLNRQTVLRLNYSYNHSSGYLNDPYKIVSVVQGPGGPDAGEPVDYLYEARPDGRAKQAVFAQLRRYLSGHTIDLSYRYFWDDWGVTSQTVELFYRLPVKAGHALQPHVRWYRQTEADFYRVFLVEAAPAPAHASADYRLAPFHAVTAGLQYLFPVGQGVQVSLGGEYYHQAGDISPPRSMGVLSTYELFPDMDAVMVRAGFDYEF